MLQEQISGDADAVMTEAALLVQDGTDRFRPLWLNPALQMQAPFGDDFRLLSNRSPSPHHQGVSASYADNFVTIVARPTDAAEAWPWTGMLMELNWGHARNAGWCSQHRHRTA